VVDNTWVKSLYFFPNFLFFPQRVFFDNHEIAYICEKYLDADKRNLTTRNVMLYKTPLWDFPLAPQARQSVKQKSLTSADPQRQAEILDISGSCVIWSWYAAPAIIAMSSPRMRITDVVRSMSIPSRIADHITTAHTR